MSLRDAVEDVAKEMEEYQPSCANLEERLRVGMWIKCLRIALKATEGQVVAPGAPVGLAASMLAPELTHMAAVEREREKMRLERQKDVAQAEEHAEVGPSYIEVRGGPAAGDNSLDMTSVNPNMPMGAHTFLCGCVYTMVSDGGAKRWLQFNEEQSRKLMERKEKEAKQSTPSAIIVP